VCCEGHAQNFEHGNQVPKTFYINNILLAVVTAPIPQAVPTAMVSTYGLKTK
jgi:hypothetical protein